MARTKLASSAVLAAVAVLIAAAAPAGGATPDRLDIGVHDPLDDAFHERDTTGAFRALRNHNIKYVRVPVVWSHIAPSAPAEATNHRDPAYQWGHLDERLRLIRNQGGEPLLYLYVPPRWALRERSAGFGPRVGDFQAFATAIAQRYNGTVPGAVRVRYWQIWNEPNLKPFLDARDNVNQYRALVNAAYPRIHAAAADNVVVAGGLAPRPAALRFMRGLMCLNRKLRVKPHCDHRISFDVWSHHPYTTGGPNHRSAERDAVSLGNLPAMVKVLRAGKRRSRVQPGGRVPFWVTEFGWDTKPPDPWGVPLRRHARWVAEALYRMWSNGVDLVVWFQIRDNEEGYGWAGSTQAGLYFRTARAYVDEKVKPVAEVIRFPFVALPARRGALVWGRTPDSTAASVVIERRRGSRWRRARTVRAGPHGIFRTRLRTGRGKVFRARVGEISSRPFTAVRTRDHRVRPFGGGPA